MKSMNGVPLIFADKDELKRILDAQDKITGFVKDRSSSPQKTRTMMKEYGILADDNSFSCEIIRIREGA